MHCATPQQLQHSHHRQAQASKLQARAVQCTGLVRHPAVQHRKETVHSRAATNDSTAAASTEQHVEVHSFETSSWQSEAAGVLSQLGLANSTTPQQLWQHLTDTQAQHPQQPALQLDISSCRLLLSAAAATCSTQQQYNQLHPLFQAAVAVFPSFQFQDFRQLLQLCAQARFVPDKEWLASIYYADTGGVERLYKEEPPESLVLLLSDIAAMLASPSALFQDLSAALSKQHHHQQQQQQSTRDTLQPPTSPPAGPEASDGALAAAEVSALQAAMHQASTNLAGIQQDPLLAGELSAVGGYWLLRRFLPALQDQPELILQGLTALPGLGYKVLDTEDADYLVSQLTPHLQSWSPNQLTTALTSSLPCLGDIPPTDGQQFALLFAAVGAAAGGMSPQEAVRVLMVLAQLPGYAPDAQVAQALLTGALQPPLTHMTARQLYQLLQAAGELGAAPSGSQLQQVQAFLSS